jgi:hypothetical protein
MAGGKSANRPIRTIMKCVLAILTISVLLGPVVAAAQSEQKQTPAPTTLVDVQKAEEARRTTVR